MKKILTVLGTRPEIIRLSRIIPKIDALCGENHKIVHTGQNYDKRLNDVFFDELGVRRPDYHIQSKSSSFAQQIAAIFKGFEEVLLDFKPEKVLILGDTNSSVTAVIAERMGIPVYHMEAGNRCFDKKVPEEVNRRIIDSISSFNIPYTLSSRENLIREGQARNKIFVSGNPIYEVMQHYAQQIDESAILQQLDLKPNNYVIVTAHREENVDVSARLEQIFIALDQITQRYQLPVIFSCHPRTAKRLNDFGIQKNNKMIKVLEPFGFFDFVHLEKHALLAITDSGTVQEECCLLKVPTVTIRDTTERPETVDCGSNIISGLQSDNILTCVETMLQSQRDWLPPEGYPVPNVSDKIIKLLLSTQVLVY